MPTPTLLLPPLKLFVYPPRLRLSLTPVVLPNPTKSHSGFKKSKSRSDSAEGPVLKLPIPVLLREFSPLIPIPIEVGWCEMGDIMFMFLLKEAHGPELTPAPPMLLGYWLRGCPTPDCPIMDFIKLVEAEPFSSTSESHSLPEIELEIKNSSNYVYQ